MSLLSNATFGPEKPATKEIVVIQYEAGNLSAKDEAIKSGEHLRENGFDGIGLIVPSTIRLYSLSNSLAVVEVDTDSPCSKIENHFSASTTGQATEVTESELKKSSRVPDELKPPKR